MSTRLRILFVMIFLLQALLSGCEGGKEDLVATSAAGTQVAAAANEAATATAAAKAAQVKATEAQVTALAATQAARATLDAQSTLDAAARATETAVAGATGTAEAFVTETALARNATATAKIYVRQTATQEAVLQRTAAAQPMFDLVQNLYDTGVISKNQGEFHAIDDFDKSWAQRGWYSYTPTGYKPENFVIDADTWWEAADKYAEDSGCGIVFREGKEGSDHYMIFYSIEGYASLIRYKGNYFNLLNRKLVDRENVTERSAHITLVVEDDWITYYIDGEQVMHWQDIGITSGNLHLTLVSGTNKDFGTHCKMTNIGLWILK